jgi:uncharacterized membrane protein YccF (DUF307 family)
VVRLVGNILWLLFGGLAVALEYLLGAVALCLTIIGIPFGIQAIKLANLALFPFGRSAVPAAEASGCLSLIMNVIWIIIAGLWIAITHCLYALLCAITIIGIPFAVQHFKLAGLRSASESSSRRPVGRQGPRFDWAAAQKASPAPARTIAAPVRASGIATRRHRIAAPAAIPGRNPEPVAVAKPTRRRRRRLPATRGAKRRVQVGQRDRLVLLGDPGDRHTLCGMPRVHDEEVVVERTQSERGEVSD